VGKWEWYDGGKRSHALSGAERMKRLRRKRGKRGQRAVKAVEVARRVQKAVDEACLKVKGVGGGRVIPSVNVHLQNSPCAPTCTGVHVSQRYGPR
jgi:hypothetical protein